LAGAGPGTEVDLRPRLSAYFPIFQEGAKVLKIAPVSFSHSNPTGNAEPARFRRTMPAALFRRADLIDPERAPAKLVVRVARVTRTARVDWFKPGYRHAAPGCQSPAEYGQTYEDLKNAARRQTW
jgi:hypothetical protein